MEIIAEREAEKRDFKSNQPVSLPYQSRAIVNVCQTDLTNMDNFRTKIYQKKSHFWEGATEVFFHPRAIDANSRQDNGFRISASPRISQGV